MKDVNGDVRGFLLAGLIAVAAGFGAASASRAEAAASLVRLDKFVCQDALSPSQREVSVQGVMRPVPGTLRMAMRFELLERTKVGGPLTEVSGGDLDHWKTPTNPTLGQRPGDVWSVDHPVIGLAAPATYRFRVTFRWTGKHGKVLATVRRESAPCVQRELRPDLVVGPITVKPAPSAPAHDKYIVLIRNTGASAAGPFQVLFVPGAGYPEQAKTIAALRAHGQRSVTFTGPACTAATTPTVTVDPNDQVDELNQLNKSLTATCPAS